MALYIDGTIRTRRTKILAGATADATFHIDHRNTARAGVAFIRRHHLYSACGAMALTVATVDIIGEHDTVLADPYGMPHLDRGLLLLGDRLDGTRRAHLGATCTLGAAITTLIGELGLHKAVEAGSGA